MERADKPHAQRRGWLKNGNLPGDFSKAPRCGAKTRRGTSCMGPAMRNGRCRMHGGCSTGPRTPEGLERIRRAHLKHGHYSREARNEARQLRQLFNEWQSLQETMDGEPTLF
ncbi:MAG: HGGxSTG domain-containing protein [bacterium]